MSDTEELIVERVDGVTWLTMNRPEVLNARNTTLRRALVDACEEAEADPQTQVIILTGSGDRSFSVGMDLKEVAAGDADLASQRDVAGTLSDAATLARNQKPTIAAINGFALGGGLELALCCDIRIAADHAQLGFPEAARGTMPGSGGTQRLPRLIGHSAALELLLTGRRVTASEAHSLGMVNSIVPAASLRQTCEDLAVLIASNAPLFLKLIKEAVSRGAELPLQAGLAVEADLAALVSTSEDAVEGSRAFVEKRAPAWQGR